MFFRVQTGGAVLQTMEAMVPQDQTGITEVAHRGVEAEGGVAQDTCLTRVIPV
jgi:hypothetical protein